MKTNNLIHHCSRTINGERVDVTIRLNDECKNGHQDFSITADVYELTNSRPRWVSGGCCHDDILSVFPEFQIFVELHLCDYLGNPMYAVSNGFYHLKRMSQHEFCKYYNIDADQYQQINSAESQLHFYLLLIDSTIQATWKGKADAAISLLESLTGNTFEVDSNRTNLDTPTDEEIAEEGKRLADGYYSDENKKARLDEDTSAKVSELRAKAEDGIAAIRAELAAKITVLRVGGRGALENFIYYGHDNSVKFNWLDYLPIVSDEAIAAIVPHLDPSISVRTK